MSSQSVPSTSCYEEGFGRWATCRSLLLSKSVSFKKMCEVTPKKDEQLFRVCWWIILRHGSVWGWKGRIPARGYQTEVRVGTGCGHSQMGGLNDTEWHSSILHKRKTLMALQAFLSLLDSNSAVCLFESPERWRTRGGSMRQEPSKADVML